MIPGYERTWEAVPLIYGHLEHRPSGVAGWVRAGPPGAERYEAYTPPPGPTALSTVFTVGIVALWLGAAALLASEFGKK